MANQLPEVINLGHVKLKRVRDHQGKPSNEWVCERNYNQLSRNKNGLYSFQGSPLDRCWTEGSWYDTPEDAYRASLKHQITQLQKAYEKELNKVVDELQYVREQKEQK